MNTAILALDRYPEPSFENGVLENVNFLFFFIYLSEVVLKLTGLGFSSFLFDGFNIFDSIIVFIGCMDAVIKTLVLSDPNAANNNIRGILSAMRAFRLLRIFKLATAWKKFRDLLKTVWKTLKDISTFSIFISLFTFIYALIGMELFAYKVKKTPDDKIDMVNGIYPLNNFNTFYESLLSMFVLLTGD